jgi:hypothetical protein
MRICAYPPTACYAVRFLFVNTSAMSASELAVFDFFPQSFRGTIPVDSGCLENADAG